MKGLKIDRLERMNSSVNGNPRFRVHFTNGIVSQTMVDDMLGLQIQNYVGENKPSVNVEFGKHYGTVQINKMMEVI